MEVHIDTPEQTAAMEDHATIMEMLLLYLNESSGEWASAFCSSVIIKPVL